jgi:very-short-patch-repair endonuclease
MKPRHSLQEYAIELRNNGTDVERNLWRRLRNSQLEGVKFRRQQPIEAYIVDFVSFEKRIVIELDGGQHAENIEYDEQRNACLRANVFVVLRFWNNHVIENIEGVLEVIRQRCLQELPPPPAPLPQGAGEQISKLQTPSRHQKLVLLGKGVEVYL